MRIWITGDTHGDFTRITSFGEKLKSFNMTPTKETDVMIILGDVGITNGTPENIYSNLKSLQNLPFTLFCVRGNHEDRPYEKYGYREVAAYGNKAMVHPDFPHIIFALDNKIYELGSRKCWVIGGAYSIDKMYRLKNRRRWYPSEQLTKEELKEVKSFAAGLNEFDVILSHTCPKRYLPFEAFISIPDKTEDHTMEEALDFVLDVIDYNEWYCGHFHIEKRIDKMRFMFEDIILFDDIE